MRGRALLREIGLNLRSGAAHPFAWAVVVLVVATAICGWDALSIFKATQDATEFRRSGASMWTFEATAAVDGASCDRLSTIDGIAGAGAIGASSPLTLSALPHTPVSQFHVTPGFAGLMLGTRSSRATLLISSGLARETGVRDGDTVATSSGPMTVDSIYDYPSDGRLPTLQYAVLVVDPEMGGIYDSCWTDIWPATPELRGAGFLAANSNDVATGQLNTRLGEAFDIRDRFTGLPSVLPAVGAVTAGAGIGVLALRLRRTEIASSRIAGVRRTDLAVITLGETAIWATPPVALVGAIGHYVSMLVQTDPDLFVRPNSVHIGVGILCGCVVAAVVTSICVNPNRLFGYVKERR